MYVFNFVGINTNISILILLLLCAALGAKNKFKNVLFLCHERNSSQNESISNSKWNNVNYFLWCILYSDNCQLSVLINKSRPNS